MLRGKTQAQIQASIKAGLEKLRRMLDEHMAVLDQEDELKAENS